MARKNQSKDELVIALKKKQKIEHEKDMVRAIFPKLEGVESIYDAQTALSAVSGYVKMEMEDMISDIKISYFKDALLKSLEKEKDSKIKDSMIAILETINNEKVEDIMDLLQRMSRAFGDFGASQFIKGPMSSIKIEDLVAE